MAAAYSMDLRTRVLRDSDAGLSSKELAERYHVSRAWVDALKQRRRETGAFAPFKPTKFRDLPCRKSENVLIVNSPRLRDAEFPRMSKCSRLAPVC